MAEKVFISMLLKIESTGFLFFLLKYHWKSSAYVCFCINFGLKVSMNRLRETSKKIVY